jgi:hypothetical protein
MLACTGWCTINLKVRNIAVNGRQSHFWRKKGQNLFVDGGWRKKNAGPKLSRLELTAYSVRRGHRNDFEGGIGHFA